MTELIGAAIVGGVGAFACGAVLSRALLRYREGAGVEPAADDSLPVSLNRYSVLTRLTGQQDERFLREISGSKPQLVSRLRRDRRVILRMYLRELAGDFHKLHRAARRMVAEAPEEQADLVGLLLRQQITFWRCLLAIEVRLALAPLGMPEVDAGPLLEAVEALRAAVSGSESGAPAIA